MNLLTIIQTASDSLGHSTVNAVADTVKALRDTTVNAQVDIQTNFQNAVDVTGKGMLGIFLFMFVFFFIIQGIDKLFPKKDTDE